MSTYLLDANVLIALTVVEHEHHDRASEWLGQVEAFAVCPIVEGALVRFVVRLGESASTAIELLRGVRQHPRCQFWPAAQSYLDTDLSTVTGHSQITDSYLTGLAAINDARMVTFDQALAARHPAETELLDRAAQL